MKKYKLKLIEAYIYAKKLTILLDYINNTIERTKIPIDNEDYLKFLQKTSHEANDLLTKCEVKINLHKLYNDSFLLVKQQLENVKLSNLENVNNTVIENMLQDFDYYLKIVS